MRVLFMIGIVLVVLGIVMNVFNLGNKPILTISIANASTRSRYLDMGDEYLKKAEQSFGFTGIQAYGILALAAYTAANAEKGQ